jgi:ribosomal protein S18 acetylase RimI-like enzyme
MMSFNVKPITKEQFVSAISSDKADSFAKTFVAKASMQNQWSECIGAFVNGELAGAIITTVSKRPPHVANLQLLHTFVKFRGLGVGKYLCEYSLIECVLSKNAEYFRVSAEPTAVDFYKKIGFKFWCKQKSKCQLSIFRINGVTFNTGIYDTADPTIRKAIYRKGKGGCTEIFDKLS